MKGQHKRRLSNSKLTKHLHGHYLGLWLVTTLALIGLLGFSLYQLEDLSLNLFSTASSEEAAFFYMAQSEIITRIFLGSLILMTAIFALAVLTAHRVAGPYLAILRTLENIQKGDWEYRLHFRKNDHLENVEQSFNETLDLLTAKEPADVKKDAA